MSTEISEVKPIIARLVRKYGHQIPEDDIEQICLQSLLEFGSPISLEPGLATVIMESDVQDELRRYSRQKRFAEHVELTELLPARDYGESRVVTEDMIQAMYRQFPEHTYIQDVLANENLADYSDKITSLVGLSRPVPLESIFKAHGLTLQNGRTLMKKLRVFLLKQGYLK